MYRGEGYMGSCTQYCYSKNEYAKRRGRVYIPPDYNDKKDHDEAIKTANEKWVKRKPPKPKSKKEINRINNLLISKHARHDQWSGKPFRTVRG